MFPREDDRFEHYFHRACNLMCRVEGEKKRRGEMEDARGRGKRVAAGLREAWVCVRCRPCWRNTAGYPPRPQPARTSQVLSSASRIDFDSTCRARRVSPGTAALAPTTSTPLIFIRLATRQRTRQRNTDSVPAGSLDSFPSTCTCTLSLLLLVPCVTSMRKRRNRCIGDTLYTALYIQRLSINIRTLNV